jgi:site-specific recombinase XerD
VAAPFFLSLVMIMLPALQALPIPATLNGSQGRNRAATRGQLSAPDDRSAVLAWLARYVDSPATLASYRKETERLLLWCTLQHRVALSDLTHEDFLVYQRFLADPQPAQDWVMAPGQKPGRESPLWRPFAGPLSESSQRQALSILNAMLSWLVQAGYLAGNPLALSRRKRRTAAPRVSRFLPQEQWETVKNAIQAMPTHTARQQLHASRCRWLFSLLYLGGLRISEVCSAAMGDFYSERSAHGRDRWWLQITGKGGKDRLVPATGELMTELIRYRKANDLSPLPAPGDSTPLVIPLIGPCKPMARSALHAVVKEVVHLAATRLREQGPEFESAAAHIERASAHWMRHTARSHLSEKADLKVVRDNLGHANISTTSIYLHTEDDARHDAISAVHRVNWRTP